MEVEMEDDSSSGNVAVEFTFTAVEIDLDYEFEAARFFDFTREESTVEAREAEMWFESVESYPPSPFAVRLISREQNENANIHTESKGFNTNQLDNVSNVVRAQEGSSMALTKTNTDGDVANGGVSLDLKSYCLQTFQKQQPRRNDNYKSKIKSNLKPSFPRTSTLMKPTASQLAKQNQERLMDHSRVQKSGNNSINVEGQAAKRQKLEGGLLCKVTDTKQQANFIHKAPKKEGGMDSKLHITVPRPPDLATAQRAQRSQRIRQKGDTGNENVASRAHGFRALPLNRKIFETPSLLQQKRSTPQLPEFQEFHLKTTERAAQNTAAVPSTSSYCNNLKVPQKPRFSFATESKQEDCETISRFKALPLNKKIFSSKGDLGVFRSSKRETTVAMVAFNFQTEKRAQNAPPIDLFNKLTLDSGSELNRPRPRARHQSIFMKGSKENRVCSFQQQSEIVNHKMTSSKQVHFDSNSAITEGITPFSTISRNLGIR
ncbi:protein TPX2 isoform X1 [Lactuca sativa]|uniref:protein TPX2 isoform X1 n=1 Tax=Lactuca sativa TaxID=4236 RepID=UPI001C68D81F|nr:protein TPX2 isoform X1 [Lactuca sativa]